LRTYLLYQVSNSDGRTGQITARCRILYAARLRRLVQPRLQRGSLLRKLEVFHLVQVGLPPFLLLFCTAVHTPALMIATISATRACLGPGRGQRGQDESPCRVTCTTTTKHVWWSSRAVAGVGVAVVVVDVISSRSTMMYAGADTLGPAESIKAP